MKISDRQKQISNTQEQKDEARNNRRSDRLAQALLMSLPFAGGCRGLAVGRMIYILVTAISLWEARWIIKIYARK